jgi:pilus assembly protein CpaE
MSSSPPPTTPTAEGTDWPRAIAAAEPLPVLLLGVDAAALADVRTRLASVPGAVIDCIQGTFDEGLLLARARTPDLVMVVMDGDARAALAVMEEINRQLPSTQIFGLSRDDSTENIVRAMRAGAAEFLNLPLTAAQIVKCLIKASALRRLAETTVAGGQIWTVYGPKGGAGATTLAANLAVELRTELGKSVCLVDLDFQAGDLALALNVKPAYTMLDIALNFRRLDSVFLQGTLTRDASGAYLLAAPLHGSLDTTPIPADQIRTVLELLTTMYDVVVVDTPRVICEETVTAFAASSRILVLLELSLPSLRGYRRMLDLCDAVNVPRDRLAVVISKHGRSKMEVPLEEAKKSLELSVAHILPRDDETAMQAINQGLPLAKVKRNSPLRRAIVDLASTLLGAEGAGAEPRKRTGIFGSLFAP